MVQTYADLETFYTVDPKRRLSPEYDFGVWWKDSAFGTWRVSWVADTGEVYALRRGFEKSETILLAGEMVTVTTAGLPNTDGPLLVLGVIPESRGECQPAGYCHKDFHGIGCPADRAYNVETVLDGWAEICGTPNSLSWVRERVK